MACSTISQRGDANIPADADNDVLAVFCRVMGTRNEFLASHHFTDNILLDWFGRSISGKSNVLRFLFDELHLANHDIVRVKNRGEHTQRLAHQRALRRFQLSSLSEKEEEFDIDDDSGFASGFYEISSDSSFSSTSSETPGSKVASDFSRLYVCKRKEPLSVLSPMSPILKTPMNTCIPSIKPLRRPLMSLRSLKLCEVPRNLQFVEASGIISFVEEGSAFNAVKKWNQRCHLQLGYYHDGSMEEPYRFSFLLYNNDMPCRRNLSQIFDECG